MEQTLQERIYELICGNWNLRDYPVPEGEFVESEFASGSFCDRKYTQMLSAYSRVCQRLGAEEWEDEDVEIIVDNLLAIGRVLSMKMYHYGMLFTRMGWEQAKNG